MGTIPGIIDLYPAPFDALAYNGMQINGAMDVSQEFGTAGTSANNSVPVDGWRMYLNYQAGGRTFTARQVATSALGGVGGLRNCLQSFIGGGDLSAPTNGDYAMLRHIIEGWRVGRLALGGGANAQPFSFGYLYYAGLPGVIATRFFNSASDRTYAVEHTVASGWNWCTGTVPGCPDGTWLTDNGVGLYVDVQMYGKSATPLVPNAWSTSNAAQTTGMTNNVLNGGVSGCVTGFIIVPGTDLPPRSKVPFLMRPYDVELPLCQRQFEMLNLPTNGGFAGMAYAAATFAWGSPYHFKTEKRAIPTMSLTGNWQAWLPNSAGAGGSVAWQAVTTAMATPTITGASGLTPGNASVIAIVSGTGTMKADARL